MLKRIKPLLERNALKIALLITIAIILLSLLSLKVIARINVSNSDKYGHLIAYTALGISWFYAFKSQRNKWMYIAILLIIFGMVLEVLQGTLTTYRTADWNDGLANASGVIIAFFVSHLWIKK